MEKTTYINEETYNFILTQTKKIRRISEIEKFKNIKDFYFISISGQVFSIIKTVKGYRYKELKPQFRDKRNKHHYVKLQTKDKKKQHIGIHIAVYYGFNSKKGLWRKSKLPKLIHHKNSNEIDNISPNLMEVPIKFHRLLHKKNTQVIVCGNEAR